MTSTTACRLVALLAVLVASAASYRVLVVFPVPGKSHSLLGEGYVRLLLRAGHEVTYITPFPMKTTSANLTQVIVEFDMSRLAENSQMNIGSLLNGKSVVLDPFALPFSLLEMGKKALSSRNVKTFLEDPKQTFDLVVAEWVYSELFGGFVGYYQCPLVWSSSLDVHAMLLRVLDEVPNPAYTADILSSGRPPFTFIQRVRELGMLLLKLFINEFIVIPKTAEIYKTSFGPAAVKRGIDLPPYEELIYNASLTFVNSHPSLGDAPSLPQNVKEIGGYHIDEPEPLPEELQNIIDAAKYGVIYFSMGSTVKSADMPEKMKRDLLHMFGQLKQTVFWKFEEQLEPVPPNVHIRSWMPQHSILAHPNTRLFITHGGLLSTTETVHFGVPVIVIPLFGDQFVNADMAARRGIAVPVQFTYELARDLGGAIQEALHNPSYSQRVRELSRMYHDRPLSPAAELVYWLEYTVRTGGAPHLRSAALMLPWYSRLYLDLLALVLGGFFTLVLLLRIFKIVFRRSKPQEKKKRN